MSEYRNQANSFMENIGATMTATFLRHAPHFEGDKDSRDIYRITLARPGNGGFKMEFDFGQSIANSAPPTHPGMAAHWAKLKKRIPPDAYSVLACLTKYEVDGDVWEFAKEYGFEINSRESYNRIDKIHMAVIQEYRDVCGLFGDVIEHLREIQ